MITKDLKNLKNSLESIDKFFKRYSKEEIYQFLLSKSGEYLGDHTKGMNTPATLGRIADIRRVYASALKVLSSEFHSSEEIKFCSDVILSNVCKNGFTIYNQIEAIIAYSCKIS